MKRPAKNTKADIKRAAEVAQKLGMAMKILPTGTIEFYPLADQDKPEPKTNSEYEIIPLM